MQVRSSNSAVARFLDRNAVLKSLRQVSTNLVSDDSGVQGVLLFGSLARGDYSRRSDADILVCLHSPRSDKPIDRIPMFLAAFLDAPVPVDVLPLTEEEIRRQLVSQSLFWRRIAGEAVLLAGTAPHSLQNVRRDW